MMVDSVTAETAFVFGYVPHRLWSFWEFPADNSAMKLAAVPKQEFEAVVVNDPHDYGSHSFEFDGVVNGRATGKVFSSATGNSYSVLAESPEGQIGNADTDRAVCRSAAVQGSESSMTERL